MRTIKTNTSRNSTIRLSSQDREHLKELLRTEAKVKLQVKGVVEGIHHGLYLYGAGGIGKSHTVLDQLRICRAKYQIINSQITPRGLFNWMRKDPDHIFVLEDIEQIFGDNNILGILRSATWGPKNKNSGEMVRKVTWSTFKEKDHFVFHGGIIVTANRCLPQTEPAQALASRIINLEWSPTQDQLKAKMRDIARRGFKTAKVVLSPKECIKVCEFIISEQPRHDQPLSLRLLENGFRDYFVAKNSRGTSWKDLVVLRLSQSFSVEPVGGLRSQNKNKNMGILHSVLKQTNDRKEQMNLWKEKSGKSGPTFYRLMKEIGSTEESK